MFEGGDLPENVKSSVSKRNGFGAESPTNDPYPEEKRNLHSANARVKKPDMYAIRLQTGIASWPIRARSFATPQPYSKKRLGRIKRTRLSGRAKILMYCVAW